tara:strand:- start:23 stop:286 length:264 start_codon:yes stop_codon:yes gene_type:complete
MSYIYKLDCSECSQETEHTINQDFEYAEATCPHCNKESFVVFGEAEQDILQDVFAEQIFEAEREFAHLPEYVRHPLPDLTIIDTREE